MAVMFVGLVIVGIYLQAVLGHICLIVPHQRGDLNISTVGNPTCSRQGDPCGGQPPQDPLYTLYGGGALFVKWQQNRNYYSVGHPGYLDVAWANINWSSSDFQLMAMYGDPYPYEQNYQRNFTAIVTVPNITCTHCVLRVRYVPHKAGEENFVQCADVRIIPGSGLLGMSRSEQILASVPPSEPEYKVFQRLSFLDNLRAPINITGDIFGFSYDPMEKGVTTYLMVDLQTGDRMPVIEYDLDLDISRSSNYLNGLAHSVPYIADAIMAVDPARDVILLILHAPLDSPDNFPGMYALFGAHNGSVLRTNAIQNFAGPAIVAVVFDNDQGYITLGINQTATAGTYEFVLGHLDVYETSNWKLISVPKITESIYVNFLWAEYDMDNKFLYVLMGNENDAFGLSSRIFTFDISSGSFVAFADLQNNEFIIMSMHYYSGTGQLYALSPGLYNASYPDYRLVVVDPLQGTVQFRCIISPSGVFERYFGGAIFNGLEQATGKLQHVLRVADTNADFIVSVDVDVCSADYSMITSLREVHNLVHVPPARNQTMARTKY